MPHGTLSGYLPVVNGRLYYEVAGGGAPLVFLHGFTLDHRMWDDQWDFFRARYRVVRYDQRGHGRSSDPDGPWSNADDLMLLLAHLGAERPHICGLSAGGGIALDFAVTYPEATRSLVLIDSAIGGYRGWSAEMRETFSRLRDIASGQGVETALKYWLDGDLLKAAMETPAVARRLQTIIGDYRGWHWLHQGQEIVPDPLPYERLEEVEAPALVITGERDIEDFRNMSDVLAQRLRNARHEVVPSAGHMANMEAPTTVNQLIDVFLHGIELHV